MRADGSARPAYAAVKQALAETGGKCTGTAIQWRHTTSVVGASLSWRSYKRSTWATATVGEDVKVVYAVVRVAGKGRVSRNAIARALADGGVPQVQAVQQGAIKAYWKEIVKVPKTGLLKGTYVAAVQLSAALAPERTVLFLGPRFTVR
jgi:hypothetical protein